MRNIAIILASGKGERTGLDTPKQFIKIAGKTVIEHTIEIFENHPRVDEIIIVSHVDYIQFIQYLTSKNCYKKTSKVLVGGDTRKDSSFIGISSIYSENAKVLIHDAVRPFLQAEIIDNCIDALDRYDAVDVAIKSADTIISVNERNIISNIPIRENLRRGQTPQAFKLKTIKKAHELANKDKNITVTDDCGLIMKYQLCDIFVVTGNDFNRKITYPIDIAIADRLFQMKCVENINNHKFDFKDKVLVVFGASRGIGKAVLELAEKQGAKVYGFSRTNGVDIKNYKAVSNSLKNVYKKEKKINFVINTAGILKIGNLSERTIEDVKEEIDVNYFGSINVAKNAKKYLSESNGNLLLFTSSSYTRGRSLYSIYSSTKAAIVNLTQALAEEWHNENIRINCICPERTATPMRFENFGREPRNSLCPVEKVAKETLNALVSNFTGQVIDVRIHNNG